MTGSFVLLVGNGRLSQTINHYLEARTKGRRLFRSLKPSAINFPLQVQWIDRGHWTHWFFHKRPDGISAKTSAGQLTEPGTARQVAHCLSALTKAAFPTRSKTRPGAKHNTLRQRAPAPSGLRDCNMAPGGLAPGDASLSVAPHAPNFGASSV